ncbi:MAG: DNA polymerase III subunit gamma/tau C-terminal domain-containing protein, partial [Woeseiaceae bacterium]|nr:DNA polymerase III subunit gamma/tau C-terminal domain-containing protein [Woeseiaceae bacterium]
ASARKTGSAATWQQPDWSRLVEALDIQGAVRLLASNCALVERSGNELRLLLDRSAESYLTRTREQTLADALSKHFGESLNVRIEIGEAPAETPMQAQSRRETETLEAARQSLESDPNVKTIIDVFGATLNSDSVRVVDK